MDHPDDDLARDLLELAACRDAADELRFAGLADLADELEENCDAVAGRWIATLLDMERDPDD
jgi:hypothetical protein